MTGSKKKLGKVQRKVQIYKKAGLNVSMLENDDTGIHKKATGTTADVPAMSG